MVDIDGQYMRRRAQAVSAMVHDRNEMLRVISSADLPRRQYHRLQQRYLRSDAAKMWAACRVLPETATDDEIRQLAECLDPNMVCPQTVQWEIKPKSSGSGHRFTCTLPPILKGNHYLIADLLAAALPHNNHLYDKKGVGTLTAIQDIKNALEEGYDWCWHGDLRDCFQSVAPDALISRLPLPRAVVRSSLDHRSLTVANMPYKGVRPLYEVAYTGEGSRRHRPWGLLQGSPASNLALATLFTDMADVFNLHDCVPCVLADNIFVAAKSEAELTAVVSEVRAYLRAHPAGRFRLHKEVLAGPGQRFVFAGCAFERDGDDIVLVPNDAGLERMYRKLADAEDADRRRGDGLIKITGRVIYGYRGAYSYWEEVGDFLDSATDRAFLFAENARRIRENIQANAPSPQDREVAI